MLQNDEKGVIFMSASGFEPKKLLSLLRNPNNSLKLEPKDDWLYGFIGAALGVAGFAFWVWTVQMGFIHSLSLIADFVLNAAVGSTPTARLFWVGIVSIIVLVTVLTIAGNRMGGRKRSWMEAAAYHGGTQTWFGAAYFVNGIIALAVWKISLVLILALLFLNLSVLVTQAAELHEVAGGRRFAYLGLVLGIYVTVVIVLFFIF
jgi:hypothetical protein